MVSNERKIVITGSEGTIGKVLRNGLPDYQITPVDIKVGRDVRDYQELLGIFPGHRAIVHLAWNTQTENWRSEKAEPANWSQLSFRCPP